MKPAEESVSSEQVYPGSIFLSRKAFLIMRNTTGEACMTTWRTTVIMKTDIKSSTARFRALPDVELAALLREHRAFVSRLAAVHDGRIVKPEGDGFWLVFPSVTAAALAARTMQEELRLARVGKGDDRLAMRIVLSLGDVLHQEGALVGDAVVLAARIEEITPPDEIYLSAAAWLVVNQAEVRTSLVDAFALKGFLQPVPVYQVEQTHRSRVITEQYIVITDLRNYTALVARSSMAEMEQILDRLFELIDHGCRECSGTNRFEAGDLYCMTFPDPSLAMAAVERLEKEWDAFDRGKGLGCPINIVVHKGEIYAFRSFLYGIDLNVAVWVKRATTSLPLGDTSIFVTRQVRRDLAGTSWYKRLQPIDIESLNPQLGEIEVCRLGKPESGSH
jgi:class 3 adenylate cyclase